MPYSAGVYTLPPGTAPTTLTPIDSSDYTAFINDIETAQNAARPVTAGGTGGTSVITGWDGLAKKGTDIATASSINLTTATGPSLTLTGTTTVTAVTLAEGSIRLVRAAGAFQITASASLLCNGSSSVNMSVAAEDLLVFRGGAGGVVSVARVGAATVASATTSAQGIVELATVAEALAGTDAVRAVTPNGLYYPTGHLFGLTLGNNAGDATNDIDIGTGTCRSSDDTANMALASALTKQLDVAWAVGTNAGMRATGVAIANTTYHIFLIKRPDTGVVDIAADTSATGANIATNTNAAYTLIRRIGSILREGGSIVGFFQDGDTFRRKAGVLDISAVNPGTAAVTRTLSVPTGITVTAIFNGGVANVGTAVDAMALFSPLLFTDVAPSNTAAPLANTVSVASLAGGVLRNFMEHRVLTNTSGQIRSRLIGSDASCTLYIATMGWIDSRGRVS